MLEAASSTQRAQSSPDQLPKTGGAWPCLLLAQTPRRETCTWRLAPPQSGPQLTRTKRVVLIMLRSSLAVGRKTHSLALPTLGTPTELADLPLLAS